MGSGSSSMTTGARRALADRASGVAARLGNGGGGADWEAGKLRKVITLLTRNKKYEGLALARMQGPHGFVGGLGFVEMGMGEEYETELGRGGTLPWG